MQTELSRIRQRKVLDDRDRLILALYAQLKAERETREAMEMAIRSGGVSMEVLEAMASDPVSAIADSEWAGIETLIAEDKSREAWRRGAGREPS